MYVEVTMSKLNYKTTINDGMHIITIIPAHTCMLKVCDDGTKLEQYYYVDVYN